MKRERTIRFVERGAGATKQDLQDDGQQSRPNLPKYKGMETFKGDQHHSSKHPDQQAALAALATAIT